MLSPQKAPERLLQLADSNMESLIVEMDQLHSRVQKSVVMAVSFFLFLSYCHMQNALLRSGFFECGRIRVYCQSDIPLTFKLTPDHSIKGQN